MKKPPLPDDSAERGLSSSRVAFLLAELDREEARAKLADDEPIEPEQDARQWRGFTVTEKTVQRAATTTPTPKRQSWIVSALKTLLGVDTAPQQKPAPKRKANFFTLE
jgi:hypothetical protein